MLCLGESDRLSANSAALANVDQLSETLQGTCPGSVIVAYEPVWAIGADKPAPDHHIIAVIRALRSALAASGDRAGSVVIYGGSAGPGLLSRLHGAVDGLFLGRFAHNPDNLMVVLEEAALLARSGKGN